MRGATDALGLGLADLTGATETRGADDSAAMGLALRAHATSDAGRATSARTSGAANELRSMRLRRVTEAVGF
ncbi:MAG: hypothetical protein U0414_20020 [Polyangiaceae bacterium]